MDRNVLGIPYEEESQNNEWNCILERESPISNLTELKLLFSQDQPCTQNFRLTQHKVKSNGAGTFVLEFVKGKGRSERIAVAAIQFAYCTYRWEVRDSI